MYQGAQSCEELMSFYKERIALEEEYARRMHAISKKAIGTYETGHLREAFEALRNETEQIARSHSNQSRKIHIESLMKLEAFTSNFVARRKPTENSVEQIRKSKQALETKVLKLKERYQIEVTKLNTYLAQANLLLGKEQDKNREKIYMQQQIVGEIRQEYQIGVKKLQEIQATWVQEWKISSQQLEQLEKERIEFIVSNVWEYSNSVSSSCVNDDASCENIRKSLEECNAEEEIDIFVHNFGTGSKIYSTPAFVDYINGESDGQHQQTVIQDSNSQTRTSSQGTLLRSNTPPPISKLDPRQSGTQHQPIDIDNLDSYDHSTIKQRPMQRRPPPSEDGQTSISNPSSAMSNPSTQGTSLHREDTGYSNPTSISSFTGSIGSEVRLSKTWNSPLRRRSRNYEDAETWNRKTSNRRSFVLDHTKPQKEYVVPPNEDPLRATLEDLKYGGNGDMKKLKEMLTGSEPSELRANQKISEAPDFRSSQSSLKTNGTTKIRPKSMIEDPVMYDYQQRKQQQIEQQQMTPSMNRSSFHAELRSMSKSSINIQAKLGPQGLPSVTRQGKRVVRHVKALFDFTATIEGELSFKVDDILSVIHMQEDGWWECEKVDDGSVGLAPYNYLERV
jgi:hypothetical protein